MINRIPWSESRYDWKYKPITQYHLLVSVCDSNGLIEDIIYPYYAELGPLIKCVESHGVDGQKYILVRQNKLHGWVSEPILLDGDWIEYVIKAANRYKDDKELSVEVW